MRITEEERKVLQRLGSVGGKKRAANQSPKKRKALAKLANQARLDKRAAAKAANEQGQKSA